MSAIAHRPGAAGVDPLIEEARRRTRRRRFAYIAACAGVAGALAWAGVAALGGSGRTPPRGFVFAQAQGPVAHALIEYQASGWTMIDVATGQQRPASRTEEIWYEPKSGLWRDVYRIDGRTRSEQVGRCRPSPKQLPCGVDYPLLYLRPFAWPPSRTGFQVTGRGTFRGRAVLWLGGPKALRSDRNIAVSEYGVDPRTHRIIVERLLLAGQPSGYVAISHRPELSSSTRFLLPANASVAVAPNATYDPWAGLVFGFGFTAARNSLGKAPLWLGTRFRGLVLRSVQSGVYRPYMAGPRVEPVRFVRFYYAANGSLDYAISIDEVGSSRPWFERQGPRPGTFAQAGPTQGSISRGGLVLRIATDPERFPLIPRNSLALARALRPLPADLRTLPTLHEQ
jgi:hypothetical protein